MPRVYNQGSEVDEYCGRTGEGSSTYDVCQSCWKKLIHAPNCLNGKLKPYNGDPQGSAGWGGDCIHPDYDEQIPAYECAVCHRKLTERVDG